MKKSLKENNSGCYDPVAFAAMSHVDRSIRENDYKKYKKVLNKIFEVCESEGFHIKGRVILVDNESGRVWK